MTMYSCVRAADCCTQLGWLSVAVFLILRGELWRPRLQLSVHAYKMLTAVYLAHINNTGATKSLSPDFQAVSHH